jgi:hypothetical protein
VAEQGITPQALLERPTLMPGLDVYLTAYHELLHDRAIGMAAGTIPWSSMQRWAVVHGIDDIDDLAAFEDFLRELEAADRKFEQENPRTKGS